MNTASKRSASQSLALTTAPPATLRIDCTGGKLQFTDDIQETPDTQYVTFTFPENRMLVYEQRLWSPYHQEGFENGVAFGIIALAVFLAFSRAAWGTLSWPEAGKSLVLYLLTLADGRELWNYEIGQPVGTSPAVVDDRVIVGAEDGNVYCFGP